MQLPLLSSSIPLLDTVTISILTYGIVIAVTSYPSKPTLHISSVHYVIAVDIYKSLNLKRYSKICRNATKYIYPGGMFKAHMSVFDELDDLELSQMIVCILSLLHTTLKLVWRKSGISRQQANSAGKLDIE